MAEIVIWKMYRHLIKNKTIGVICRQRSLKLASFVKTMETFNEVRVTKDVGQKT